MRSMPYLAPVQRGQTGMRTKLSGFQSFLNTNLLLSLSYRDFDEPSEAANSDDALP